MANNTSVNHRSAAIAKKAVPSYTNGLKICDYDEVKDKIKVKDGELPSKYFEIRNSPLTDLYGIKHVRAIYHVCIAILVSFFLHALVESYIYRQEINIGLGIVIRSFPNFHLFILIWSLIFLSTFSVYFGFKCWATIRFRLRKGSNAVKSWDKLWIGLYITYQIANLHLMTYAMLHGKQSIAGRFGFLCEYLRLLMKTHAYVRSNAPKILKHSINNEKKNIPCPTLKQFLYFSFAPTLIYQDTYPRSTHVRWKVIARYVVEFFATLMFLGYLIENHYIATYKNIGLEPFTWQDIVVSIFEKPIPAILLLLCVFNIVLHIWQNAFAEMLLFGDRMFYKDWWTSTSYERYYRTWNVVVHDWLYTYVYKDFYEIVRPRNKMAAKYAVFLISAIFHEYILAFAFGFFFPLLFVNFFVFGVFMTFIKIKNETIGNVVFWYIQAIGMSVNATFYCIEYYARQNCPVDNSSLSSYFIPQFVTCNIWNKN